MAQAFRFILFLYCSSGHCAPPLIKDANQDDWATCPKNFVLQHPGDPLEGVHLKPEAQTGATGKAKNSEYTQDNIPLWQKNNCVYDQYFSGKAIGRTPVDFQTQDPSAPVPAKMIRQCLQALLEQDLKKAKRENKFLTSKEFFGEERTHQSNWPVWRTIFQEPYPEESPSDPSDGVTH